jgi:regulatory protein
MGTVAYTVEQALEKMRHFCAYQERCHGEVRLRLRAFPLDAEELEMVVSRLIEDDFLNEDRFAVAFAGGKFRMLQWGRVRIRYELKRKGVSDYNIRKGLTAIDDGEYLRVLDHLAEGKWASEKRRSGDEGTRRRRVAAYLVQKGYEPDLVWEAVGRLSSGRP